ncbi:MAG: tyrosine-type recombinase/integrase [Myxococcales bacterium]|nr:tyrosine-type recombinase/integrase [Myxococcales bacterium]
MRRKRQHRGNVCVYYDKKTKRHRVQVTRSDRSRVTHSCATEAQAKSIAAEAREQLQNECQTIGQAIEMYLDELRDRGVTHEYIVSVRCHLYLMFPDRDNQHITQLRPNVCKRMYRDVRNLGKSVDYHRNCLITSRSMAKWLVEEGVIESNPFAEIEGKGKRKKGKTQLTMDESRRFLNACVTYEHPILRADGRNRMRTPKLDPQIGVTAAMTCLLLGLRCSEIARLSPRSIDEGGTILRVEQTKTEAGKRKLQIPEILQSRMPALVAADITRNHISNWVHKMCRIAGVTEVGPHALRGTHASLATDAGATGPLVSAALGHASQSVTKGHYTDANATAQAAQRSALSRLNWEAKLKGTSQGTSCLIEKEKPQGGSPEVSKNTSLLN